MLYLLYADVISFFVTRNCQKKKSKKIANTDGENLHIF